jgi:TRAP-type mannitol/chloroaromatic compound transport system permease small subunit
MQRLADQIDLVVLRIGNIAIWLVLLVVFLQFFVVVFRYVFGVNSIEVQELITILHGLIFMLAAAYVLQIDKHVRVDIFYANLSIWGKTVTNMLGATLLLLPMALIIWSYSWPYVAESWLILEGSPDASGLRVRYLQKSAILFFALTMGLQGISIALRGFVNIGASRPKINS